LILSACATSQAIDEPGRGREYLVSCWYFGWDVCHSKATSLCPGTLYKVISQEDHGQGRSMRISCVDKK